MSAFSLGTMGQLEVCGTAEGQGRYWLTQDRQVLLQLLSRPAQSTLDAVAMSPGGFSCFSLFNLAAVEARATALVSLSVRAVRPRLRKEKNSSLHPLYRAWGSCHFLQKRNQDKAFTTTFPGPNPRRFNGLLSPGVEEQYFALGSNVSPTLPSECKYLKTKPCPCLMDALGGQVVWALLACARFGESSQFTLSPAGWLWVRPPGTHGAQFLSLRLLTQAASLR